MAEPTKQELAVKNESTAITYKTSSGDTVTLTPAMVRKLTNNNRYITEDEIVLFIETCKFQKLNPFIKEAYLVKYDGNKPASTVVSLGAFMRIADENKNYGGIEDGVTVRTAQGAVVDRQGAIMYPGETLIGGWAKVHRSDRVPCVARASYKECSKGQAMWNNSPCMMINKVAKVWALRKAFPSAFAGMYVAEEVTGEQSETPDYAGKTEEEFDIPMTDGAAAQLAEDIIVMEPLEGADLEAAQQQAAASEPASGVMKTIPYGEYKNHKEQYELVPNSYDAAAKTCQVICQE